MGNEMPIAVVKGSIKYCMENKLFFLFVLIIYAMSEYLLDIVHTPISDLTSMICFILTNEHILSINSLISVDNNLYKSFEFSLLFLEN